MEDCIWICDCTDESRHDETRVYSCKDKQKCYISLKSIPTNVMNGGYEGQCLS